MTKVTRETTESKIVVSISPAPIAPDYRKKINTPLPFLSHMLEQIVWRCGFNIEVDITLDKFDLAHVVCEDLGQTVGRAFLEYSKSVSGTGFGDGIGIIDEAKADSVISLEGRSLFSFSSAVEIPPVAEGMASEDLLVFLDGFAQGANATVHLDVQKGENSHHIWEAAFRAFGVALGRTYGENPARKGMTSGVAGAIKYTVEA
ncbi:MAG: hypothetical protein J1F63_10070 [Oscillospiraceae bacterium]|nr:hypothetical protein [Oscillospiraceae bacterium]